MLGEEELEGLLEDGDVGEGGHGGVGWDGVVWEVEDVDGNEAVELGLVAVDGVAEAEGVGES